MLYYLVYGSYVRYSLVTIIVVMGSLFMCECNVNVSSLVHNIETHACLDISPTRASMIGIIDNHTRSNSNVLLCVNAM